MADIFCGPIPPEYYVGVRADAELVEEGGRKILCLPPTAEQDAPINLFQAIWMTGFGLLDMPFSAVADTCLLPSKYLWRNAHLENGTMQSHPEKDESAQAFPSGGAPASK
jgi:uncharacterized protein YceK